MAYLSTAQLEFLGPSNRIQCSGSALESKAGSANQPIRPHFETVETCRCEGRRRAAALREFDEGLLSSDFGDNGDDWLFERNSDEVAILLDKIADPDRTLPRRPDSHHRLSMTFNKGR